MYSRVAVSLKIGDFRRPELGDVKLALAANAESMWIAALPSVESRIGSWSIRATGKKPSDALVSNMQLALRCAGAAWDPHAWWAESSDRDCTRVGGLHCSWMEYRMNIGRSM
jgi:hypothetical protein